MCVQFEIRNLILQWMIVDKQNKIINDMNTRLRFAFLWTEDQKSTFKLCAAGCDFCILVSRRLFAFYIILDYPKLVGKFKTKSSVCGIACINKRIYVVHCESDRIFAYADTAPYAHLKDIVIKDLEDARDILACTKTSKLYVADSTGRAIWQVDVKPYENRFFPRVFGTHIVTTKVEKCIETQYQPWSMSLKSHSRLLVTPSSVPVLYVYDVMDQHCKLLQKVELPSYMRPQHAVESKHGTFIVCHRGHLREDTEHNQVSEVDVTGNVSHAFCGQLQLNWPRHLALDSSAHVLVADKDISRIILLNETLDSQRVILDENHGELMVQPLRLSYQKKSKKLFVGLWDGFVNIYEWKQT